jgi:HD-like signal output (HDOD) protein
MATAVLAGLLGQYVKIDGRFNKQHLYLCGLLHNIGILMLVHAVPDEMSRVFTALRSDEKKGLTAWEQELLGTDHHLAGGWLTRKWQLPTEVVAVIEHHHDLTFRSQHWELPLFIGYCKEWAKHWMADVSEPPEMPMVTNTLGITSEDLQIVRSRFHARFGEIAQVARQIGL